MASIICSGGVEAGPNVDTNGDWKPGFFYGSAGKLLLECQGQVHIPSLKPNAATLYKRMYGLKASPAKRRGGVSIMKNTDPMLLPFVMELWKTPVSAQLPLPEPRRAKGLGVPPLLPPWLEDHMSALNSVSDRFSCTVALALAWELEQCLVANIMKEREAGLWSRMEKERQQGEMDAQASKPDLLAIFTSAKMPNSPLIGAQKTQDAQNVAATKIQVAWRAWRRWREEEERHLDFIVSRDVRSLIGVAAMEAVKQARRKVTRAAMRRSMSRRKRLAALEATAAVAAVGATEAARVSRPAGLSSPLPQRRGIVAFDMVQAWDQHKADPSRASAGAPNMRRAASASSSGRKRPESAAGSARRRSPLTVISSCEQLDWEGGGAGLWSAGTSEISLGTSLRHSFSGGTQNMDGSEQLQQSLGRARSVARGLDADGMHEQRLRVRFNERTPMLVGGQTDELAPRSAGRSTPSQQREAANLSHAPPPDSPIRTRPPTDKRREALFERDGERSHAPPPAAASPSSSRSLLFRIKSDDVTTAKTGSLVPEQPAAEPLTPHAPIQGPSPKPSPWPSPPMCPRPSPAPSPRPSPERSPGLSPRPSAGCSSGPSPRPSSKRSSAPPSIPSPILRASQGPSPQRSRGQSSTPSPGPSPVPSDALSSPCSRPADPFTWNSPRSSSQNGAQRSLLMAISGGHPAPPARARYDSPYSRQVSPSPPKAARKSPASAQRGVSGVLTQALTMAPPRVAPSARGADGTGRRVGPSPSPPRERLPARLSPAGASSGRLGAMHSPSPPKVPVRTSPRSSSNNTGTAELPGIATGLPCRVAAGNSSDEATAITHRLQITKAVPELGPECVDAASVSSSDAPYPAQLRSEPGQVEASAVEAATSSRQVARNTSLFSEWARNGGAQAGESTGGCRVADGDAGTLGRPVDQGDAGSSTASLQERGRGAECSQVPDGVLTDDVLGHGDAAGDADGRCGPAPGLPSRQLPGAGPAGRLQHAVEKRTPSVAAQSLFEPGTAALDGLFSIPSAAATPPAGSGGFSFKLRLTVEGGEVIGDETCLGEAGEADAQELPDTPSWRGHGDSGALCSARQPEPMLAGGRRTFWRESTPLPSQHWNPQVNNGSEDCSGSSADADAGGAGVLVGGLDPRTQQRLPHYRAPADLCLRQLMAAAGDLMLCKDRSVLSAGCHASHALASPAPAAASEVGCSAGGMESEYGMTSWLQNQLSCADPGPSLASETTPMINQGGLARGDSGQDPGSRTSSISSGKTWQLSEEMEQALRCALEGKIGDRPKVDAPVLVFTLPTGGISLEPEPVFEDADAVYDARRLVAQAEAAAAHPDGTQCDDVCLTGQPSTQSFGVSTLLSPKSSVPPCRLPFEDEEEAEEQLRAHAHVYSRAHGLPYRAALAELGARRATKMDRKYQATVRNRRQSALAGPASGADLINLRPLMEAAGRHMCLEEPQAPAAAKFAELRDWAAQSEEQPDGRQPRDFSVKLMTSADLGEGSSSSVSPRSIVQPRRTLKASDRRPSMPLSLIKHLTAAAAASAAVYPPDSRLLAPLGKEWRYSAESPSSPLCPATRSFTKPGMQEAAPHSLLRGGPLFGSEVVPAALGPSRIKHGSLLLPAASQPLPLDWIHEHAIPAANASGLPHAHALCIDGRDSSSGGGGSLSTGTLCSPVQGGGGSHAWASPTTANGSSPLRCSGALQPTPLSQASSAQRASPLSPASARSLYSPRRPAPAVVPRSPRTSLASPVIEHLRQHQMQPQARSSLPNSPGRIKALPAKGVNSVAETEQCGLGSNSWSVPTQGTDASFDGQGTGVPGNRPVHVTPFAARASSPSPGRKHASPVAGAGGQSSHATAAAAGQPAAVSTPVSTGLRPSLSRGLEALRQAARRSLAVAASVGSPESARRAAKQKAVVVAAAAAVGDPTGNLSTVAVGRADRYA